MGRIYRMILMDVGWCILLSSGSGTAKGGPKGLGWCSEGGGKCAGGGASVEVAWR